MKKSDFKTFKITKLDNGYEELSYEDTPFFKKFVSTDEWWDLDYLPADHKYFDLNLFINQLKVYSEEYNNPPVVEFEIGIRSKRLQELPHYITSEESPRLVRLDGIITMLKRVNWHNNLTHHCGSFVYVASLICKANRSKKHTNRRKTNIPRGLRHEVFKRDNYTCVECGAKKEDGATLHVDHKIPVSKGGTDELDNLQTLCSDCNLNKSDVIQ
jgi:hypothetical protein